jgi:hypothetical protein
MRAGILSLLVLCLFTAFANATVFEACVNGGNGTMRLVDASTLCHANETRVQWNQEGLQGPPGAQGIQGIQGPPGPAGASAGGPPFVYVCTPINFHNAGTTTDYLFVYNGSSSTANVAVNPLSKNGTNLAGQPIPVSAGTIAPGDPTPLYPGQTGSSTTTLAAGNTMFLTWFTGQGNLNTDTNIAVTMRITSDQPIVAVQNMMWSGFLIAPCTLLPK